jgi:LmbE family N-acetylglucosaminyl deacetylase
MTEEEQRKIAEAEAAITTEIDIRPELDRKRDALLAHGSQITDSWFSKIPPQVAEEAFGVESFTRVRGESPQPVPETDLFAGLR